MGAIKLAEFKADLRRANGVSFNDIENYKTIIPQILDSLFPPKDLDAKLKCAALLSLYTFDKEPGVIELFCRNNGLLDANGEYAKDRLFSDIKECVDKNRKLLVTALLCDAKIFTMVDTLCGIERIALWKHNEDDVQKTGFKRNFSVIQQYPPAGAKFLGVPGLIAADGQQSKDNTTFADRMFIEADPDKNVRAGELKITRNSVGTLVFKFVFKENFPAPPHGLTLHLEGRGDPVQLKHCSYDPFFEKRIVESEGINDIDDPGQIGKIYYERLDITDSAGEADK
jgi:hypothetical protein